MEAYNDEGYIYAQIRPVTERVPSTDSVRKVNLRWEIDERTPAIVNRIEIVGNDYTHESCIREQIVLAPGQVFNRNYLIRSYQNIGNLNFFETPMTAPETRPSGEQGDVDIVFNVKEKRTGNVNFGASMGQGTGIGGFIGLDQPNLLGRCKRAQLQWQFGRYINDFNATYSDPNIRQSRISGSLTAYHSRSRFQLAELGGAIRTGGRYSSDFPYRIHSTPGVRLLRREKVNTRPVACWAPSRMLGIASAPRLALRRSMTPAPASRSRPTVACRPSTPSSTVGRWVVRQRSSAIRRSSARMPR